MTAYLLRFLFFAAGKARCLLIPCEPDVSFIFTRSCVAGNVARVRIPRDAQTIVENYLVLLLSVMSTRLCLGRRGALVVVKIPLRVVLDIVGWKG